MPFPQDSLQTDVEGTSDIRSIQIDKNCVKPFYRNNLFVHNTHFVVGIHFIETICESKGGSKLDPPGDADGSRVGINSSTLWAIRHCLTQPSRQTCGFSTTTRPSFNMREIRTPMRREASGRQWLICIWCIATSTTWLSELKASHQRTPGMPWKPMRRSVFPFGIRRARR